MKVTIYLPVYVFKGGEYPRWYIPKIFGNEQECKQYVKENRTIIIDNLVFHYDETITQHEEQ